MAKKQKGEVMRDYLNEIAIRAAMRAHLIAYWLQRWSADAHKRLIARRSPERVARMEESRGIR